MELTIFTLIFNLKCVQEVICSSNRNETLITHRTKRFEFEQFDTHIFLHTKQKQFFK